MAKIFPKVALKQILPHIYFCDHVKIYDTTDDDGDELVFEGSVMDVPWTLLNMVLDSDVNGEAISCDSHTDEYGATIGIMTICVKEDTK